MIKPEIDLAEFGVRVKPHMPCWHARLAKEQIVKVDEAKRLGYSARVIADVVTGWGVPIKQNVVYQHFSGSCGCPR